jgi:hypothetical protein
MARVAERSQVARNGKIPEVPQQLAPECCPLLTNWFMPSRSAGSVIHHVLQDPRNHGEAPDRGSIFALNRARPPRILCKTRLRDPQRSRDLFWLPDRLATSITVGAKLAVIFDRVSTGG